MMGFFNPFVSPLGGGGGTPPGPQPESKILYNTTAYWNSVGDQITQPGVLYIYSDAKDWNGGKAPRLKIGNGILSIREMPFIDEYQTTPGEPMYVDPGIEDLIDPGVQDIFYNSSDESASFSDRTHPSSDADPDNERIIFNF